eukprot:506881-Hanusia_phi.AAC.1
MTRTVSATTEELQTVSVTVWSGSRSLSPEVPLRLRRPAPPGGPRLHAQSNNFAGSWRTRNAGGA